MTFIYEIMQPQPGVASFVAVHFGDVPGGHLYLTGEDLETLKTDMGKKVAKCQDI